MDNYPARNGWLWIKDGFALFRKQPAELVTLFIGYMFLMFLCGVIPVIGQLLPLILVPVFSMAFMQACVNIEQGKRVYPNLLLTGFRSSALPTLLKLGGLYVLAAIVAIGASSLIDGGVFWKVMTGRMPLDAKAMQSANMGLAMLVAAAVYTPAAMAFWYAAPLAAWQGMGLGKSIFYSFFAVRRAGKAFIVYGLAWALIGVFLPVIFSTLIALLTGAPRITMVILLPVSIILTVAMYCSFYSTYTHVFGKPDSAATPAQ
ncbi:MAG: hypothetical protein JWQ23_3457 [Herminiimonas sp.]|jgi:hypothetical protein|nr:hypothetical protein [Herminiimonas sp.]